MERERPRHDSDGDAGETDTVQIENTQALSLKTLQACGGAGGRGGLIARRRTGAPAPGPGAHRGR